MNKIRSFFNSIYFIVLIYLITIVLWWYDLPIVAMILYLFLILIIIIANINRITIITILFAAIIVFKDTSLGKTGPIVVIAAVIAVPLLLYDIFKTKINLDNKILVALFIFLGANILSMINTTSDTFSFGVLGVGQTFAFVLLFLYFSNRQKDGDYVYVAKNAMILGLAIGIEFIIYAITYEGDLMGKDIQLGWGMSNSIAMLVTLLVPLTYSLYIENQKNKFVLFAVVVELIIILFMLSKGGYLATLVMLPIMGIIAYKRVPNKKVLIYDQIITFALLGIALLAVFQIAPLREGFVLYFDRMDDRGWFIDESRIDIYKYAISIFNRFPIFGSGTYTGIPYLVEGGYLAGLLHYHNIFLHSMATLGIVGLISFLYFLYTVFKSLLVKHTYNLFVFAAIVAMIVHGMVDNTWYNPLVMICILTALSVIGKVEKNNLVLN